MIIRDPLYNYISIERGADAWLLALLDCPEFQRLRRIHQLGLSHLTFPGADHSRLLHSLGVLHLMRQVLDHLDATYNDAQVGSAREPMLAAALLHDVGHGPFSHLFESCVGGDHEAWSVRIILRSETVVNQVLSACDQSLPRTVAALIDPANHEQPSWQKNLLSSQLDVDRLDYLRRDSLFSGADYGHFDWYRLITTLELYEDERRVRDIVWPEKSKLAIEAYIFARYYMYQNVYLHKTTCGFTKMVEAIWKRAKALFDAGAGADLALLPPILTFWSAADPSVQQYLAIEEYTLLQQIQNWVSHRDKPLADLSRRFLDRQHFAMIEAPDFSGKRTESAVEWERALRRLVGSITEFEPPEMYCLVDRLEGKADQPYIPEKQSDQQSIASAIRVRVDGMSRPVEVSELLPRLLPVTQKPCERFRYYVPRELQAAANKLRAGWAF
jgi:HD superfamily phosphohydrolase